MNRRGTVRVAAGVGTALAGAVWGAMEVIPEPHGSVFPQTWSGVALWIGFVLTTCGFLWLIFGPFLKERLRRFLQDAETLLLLTKLLGDMLQTPDVGRVIKAVCIAQFPERFEETEEMWSRIVELEREVTSVRQSFAEVVEPSLERIEQSTRGLEQQLREARDSTAQALENAVQRVRDEFRDHGGRRMNPR